MSTNIKTHLVLLSCQILPRSSKNCETYGFLYKNKKNCNYLIFFQNGEIQTRKRLKAIKCYIFLFCYVSLISKKMPQEIPWHFIPFSGTFLRWSPKKQWKWGFFVLYRKFEIIIICIMKEKTRTSHNLSLCQI